MLLAGLAAACGSSPAAQSSEAPVLRQHAVNLRANYADVIARLEDLQNQVADFVEDPSEAGLDSAREAWLAARPAYGQCEVSRFYGGPLDEAQGRMNEWPIDENLLDYTADEPDGGIVNRVDDYPEITVDVLKSEDHQGGLENLPAGFHAIEFLLWGQRLSQSDGPGERPYTDYVDGGTAKHQDRRRAYLQAAVDLLLSDMKSVEAEWDLEVATSYAGELLAGSAHEGLTRVIRGFTNLSIAELYYERLVDPYVTLDRKDEESCFSESTYLDIVANAMGVENTYLGVYGSLVGPSVSDLVKAKDPALDATLREQLHAATLAIQAIPQPFDHTVIAPADSQAHQQLDLAVQAFWPLEDTFREMASTLGVVINL